MENAVSLVPLVLIVVVFWLLIIRPARRRQQEVAAVQASAAVGSHIMTASGIFGRIVGEDGERLQLEIAQGVVIEVHRHSVGRVLDDEDAAAEPDNDSEH